MSCEACGHSGLHDTHFYDTPGGSVVLCEECAAAVVDLVQDAEARNAGGRRE